MSHDLLRRCLHSLQQSPSSAIGFFSGVGGGTAAIVLSALSYPQNIIVCNGVMRQVSHYRGVVLVGPLTTR